MPPSNRRRILELEKESDEIKAEVLVMWNRIRRVLDELATLRDEVDERQSQSALPPYREELPSETKFSLYPTGMRVLLKNTKPSAFLTVVLVIGIIVLTWLFLRPR